MKHIAVLAVLAIAVLGCDISRFVKTGENSNSNASKPGPSPETKATPKGTPKPETSPEPAAFLSVLKKSAGKYPSDVKFLEIAELRDRLKKLLGKDYVDLKAKFNVEIPIEVSGDIVKAEACEAHNCGSNRYIVFVDTKSDNVNVYHIEDEVPKTFFESGEIKLPTKFAADLSGDK